MSSSGIEFFKVYLSSRSSRQLRLPPAFVVQLKERLSENGTLNGKLNGTLRDYTGKLWHVGLQLTKLELIITDGWDSFALSHCLVDGDFLIFKFHGCFYFDVELYSSNGLKKGNCLAGKEPNVHVFEDEEEVPVLEAKNKGSEKAPKRAGRSRKSSGVRRFQTSERKFQECNVTKDAVPQNPCFFTNMSSSSQYIYLPRSFLEAHNIKMKNYVELCDKSCRLWPVKLNPRPGGTFRLTTGWLPFLRRNKLSREDKFAFEFILSDDNVCNIIKVRVVPERRRRGRPSAKEA